MKKRPVYAFVIEPSEHAELSASSAERWLTCSGSPGMSQGLPNVASAYAAEGTAAHWVAAECQRGGADPTFWLGKMALVEGFEIPLDEDLIDAVQEFLDYVNANELPGDVAFVEQSFTPAMRRLHPKFGGSTDRVMWRASERLLRVYDYKHGAGVPVDVDDNKQLKYYALGALLSNPQWNAETVELVIAQPRCDHEQGRIRSYRFPAFDLLEFSADLIEGARATEDPLAKLVPTKKGCQFCPAFRAKVCPAVEKRAEAVVQAAFSGLALDRYSPAQIAEFLEKAPLVEAHISAVREFAYHQAMHSGVDFPGWKIVEKRPTRKWTDEAAVAKAAKARDIAADELYVQKLRSPAQLEKHIGKKAFKVLEDHVEKKSSGYVLAPSADPRPLVTPTTKALELFDVPQQKNEQ